MAVPRTRPTSPHAVNRQRQQQHRCKRQEPCSNSNCNAADKASGAYKNSFKKPTLPDHSQYIAMDCEMVGSATGESLCARAALVDWKGKVVYDSYVMPNEPIADYRTFVSGIVASDLVGAPPLDVVRAQVLELIQGKIVVGHALENDFACLHIADHPWYDTRDTATYRPFLQTNRFGKQVPRKLRDLAQEKLSKAIQCLGQAHCPAEDARTAMALYKCHRPRWEACVAFDLNKEREQQQRQEQVLRTQQLFQQQQFIWQQQQHQDNAPAPQYAAMYGAPPQAMLQPMPVHSC